MGTVAPHVVVIPLPLHGHFNPLLQLSVQLASRGVTVSFITTNSTKPRVVSALSSILEDDDDGHPARSNLRFLSLNDGDCSEKMRGIATLFFMGSKADEVEQLVESCCPVSCIILDVLLARILPGVGASNRIPTALFWTASAVHLLMQSHLKLLVERGYAPLKFGENVGTTIDSSVIPGITQLRLCEDLPYVFQKEPAHDPRFEKMLTINLQRFLEAPWVLVNTFQEMEDDALCAMQNEGVKIVTVGPLLPMELNSSSARLDGASNRILEWLSTQPCSSVLYVSFGTMAEISGEQAEELANGLEASGQPFLWALGNLDDTWGRDSSFLQEFKPRTEDRGLMVSWCPQLHVLRHPSVGGFLTHCGWNSIMESVSSGLPMIGWPCIAEQNLNCKYMVDVWKIGTRISTRSRVDGNIRLVGRGEIERAIRGLMASNEGNAMRKRARELREAARRAVHENGSSLRNINDLVAGVRELHAEYSQNSRRIFPHSTNVNATTLYPCSHDPATSGEQQDSKFLLGYITPNQPITIKLMHYSCRWSLV